MLQKQLHNIIFQKKVFSGGSNPNSGEQQPPNENNEDRFIPPVNPNMPDAIQRAQLLFHVTYNHFIHIYTIYITYLLHKGLHKERTYIIFTYSST